MLFRIVIVIVIISSKLPVAYGKDIFFTNVEKKLASKKGNGSRILDRRIEFERRRSTNTKQGAIYITKIVIFSEKQFFKKTISRQEYKNHLLKSFSACINYPADEKSEACLLTTIERFEKVFGRLELKKLMKDHSKKIFMLIQNSKHASVFNIFFQRCHYFNDSLCVHNSTPFREHLIPENKIRIDQSIKNNQNETYIKYQSKAIMGDIKLLIFFSYFHLDRNEPKKAKKYFDILSEKIDSSSRHFLQGVVLHIQTGILHQLQKKIPTNTLNRILKIVELVDLKERLALKEDLLLEILHQETFYNNLNPSKRKPILQMAEKVFFFRGRANQSFGIYSIANVLKKKRTFHVSDAEKVLVSKKINDLSPHESRAYWLLRNIYNSLFL